ncbi:MAG TPA: hypothetical protein P5140_08760 [Methanofastidiosum sp.]|nr:hypothetical protein [Methanofastidiosum sp.]
MELKFSDRGRPYIEFDDGDMMIFAEETSTPTHYKYFIYSGVVTTTVALSGNGKKKGDKKIATVSNNMSFIIPCNFKGIPRDVKKVLADDIETLSDYVTPFLENGMFPKKKINELQKVIENEQE